MINRINIYSHQDFNEKMYRLGIDRFNVENEKDKAFISIVGTPEIMKTYLKRDNNPIWFPNNTHNVLNLQFDDINTDSCIYKEYKFFGITEEQAKQCVEFIEKNKGKNFYIHCRQGKSRSQGVGKYILETYGNEYGYYENISFRKENPCIKPNTRVIELLKKEYIKLKIDDI